MMNSSRPCTRFRVLALVALAGLALSGSAFAQNAPDKNDTLKGPEVVERRAPRAEGDFGGGGPGFKSQKPGDGRAMMGAYRQAFGAVLGNDAATDLQASGEQREKIESIFREHAEKVRSYMEQHRDQIRTLRSGDGDENAKGANRQKIEELISGAPNAKDAFNQAWQLLSPAQQTAVKARLDEAEKRIAKEREDRYVEQHAGRGKPGKAGKKPGPDGAAPPPAGEDRPAKRRGPEAGREGARPPEGAPGPRAGGPIPPERRERLMALFARMTPEQQEQFLRRMEDRLGQGGPAGQGGPGPRGRGPQGNRGEPRPAPPMDEVDVPAPAPMSDDES
jgi:Spy/CpxP family protein refolding chaperone